LAKKFLPGMSAGDAVKFACRAAEVGTLPGGKVALFGTTLVDISSNADSALAQCIYHVAFLSRTSLHNYKGDKRGGAAGRIERLIGRIISVDEFDDFQRQIRPQIHDLCERVDGMLQPLERRATRLRKNKVAVGMGIYLYADRGFAKFRRTVTQ
jgi:hypothetical protein